MNNINLVSDIIFYPRVWCQFIYIQTRVKKTQFSIFRKENFFQLTWHDSEYNLFNIGEKLKNQLIVLYDIKLLNY